MRFICWKLYDANYQLLWFCSTLRLIQSPQCKGNMNKLFTKRVHCLKCWKSSAATGGMAVCSSTIPDYQISAQFRFNLDKFSEKFLADPDISETTWQTSCMTGLLQAVQVGSSQKQLMKGGVQCLVRWQSFISSCNQRTDKILRCRKKVS